MGKEEKIGFAIGGIIGIIVNFVITIVIFLLEILWSLFAHRGVGIMPELKSYNSNHYYFDYKGKFFHILLLHLL